MKEEVYSVRMRAAEGGPHEQGGFHISGGEALIAKSLLEDTAVSLLRKALTHSRGEADFVQIVVEKIRTDIVHVAPLSITTEAVESVEEGTLRATNRLLQFGVSQKAIDLGIELLRSSTNLRGAAILSSSTGKRLDKEQLRGVRATRMGWDQKGYTRWHNMNPGLNSPRIAEAVALASKVAHAPYMVAELCWSDDPEYVTGYVACLDQGYVRITHLKEKGSYCGGRIFYVQDHAEMDSVRTYLEETPVLVG